MVTRGNFDPSARADEDEVIGAVAVAVDVDHGEYSDVSVGAD
ncbi:MAG: hypothetical protein QM784_18970 [Polyangiaceae bacterium]